MGIVIALAVIIVVYLLLIMPRILNRPDDTALKGWYYAHRGFHDNQTAAPEKSAIIPMQNYRSSVFVNPMKKFLF